MDCLMNIRQYAFSTHDLFDTLNTRELHFKKKEMQDKYNAKDKQRMCTKVFLYFLKVLLLDIIENNVIFVLPLGTNREATMQITPVRGEALKSAKQHGAMQDIDILETNFVGYKITLTWQNKDHLTEWFECPIYIDKYNKEIFLQHVHNGDY